MTQPPDRSPHYRVPPLDFARALAIIAVVWTHAITKFTLGAPEAGGVGPSELLVLVLEPLRMPLFFLVSGILASRAIERPWSVVWRDKVALYYYLYVLWLTVQTVAALALPAGYVPPTVFARGIVTFLLQLTVDPSNLWYLWALATYYPVTKLLQRIPWTTLIVAGVASVLVSMDLLPLWGNVLTAGRSYIWFVIGAFFAPKMLAFLRPQRHVIVLGSVAMFGLVAVVYVLSLPMGSRALSGALFAACSFAGVAAALAVLSRTHALADSRTGRSLTYIGKNTVWIYVFQMPLIVIADLILTSSGGATVTEWWRLALTASLAAIVVCTALALGSILARFAPLLFTPPWLTASAAAREGTTRRSYSK